MSSLQYALEEGNRDGWFESLTIVVVAIVSVVALVTFIVHELETENPAVDLRVFADRGYLAATALNFLVGTSIIAGSFVLSLYLAVIMHYRALDIGLVFLRGSWIQLLLFHSSACWYGASTRGACCWSEPRRSPSVCG